MVVVVVVVMVVGRWGRQLVADTRTRSNGRLVVRGEIEIEITPACFRR